jgi:hypothetical protein
MSNGDHDDWYGPSGRQSSVHMYTQYEVDEIIAKYEQRLGSLLGRVESYRSTVETLILIMGERRVQKEPIERVTSSARYSDPVSSDGDREG